MVRKSASLVRMNKYVVILVIILVFGLISYISLVDSRDEDNYLMYTQDDDYVVDRTDRNLWDNLFSDEVTLAALPLIGDFIKMKGATAPS